MTRVRIELRLCAISVVVKATFLFTLLRGRIGFSGASVASMSIGKIYLINC